MDPHRGRGAGENPVNRFEALGFEADDEEGASHGVVEKHSLELDVTCDGEDVFEDEDESEQQPKCTYAKYL